MYKRRAMGKGASSESSIMDDAQRISQNLYSKSTQEDAGSTNSSFNQSFSKHPGVESVVSMGSTLGKQARTLVGSFACGTAIDEPNGQANNGQANNATQAWRDRRNGNVPVDKSRYNDNYAGNGRSFRESSRHVDV
jgi:hypothetical protein